MANLEDIQRTMFGKVALDFAEAQQHMKYQGSNTMSMFVTIVTTLRSNKTRYIPKDGGMGNVATKIKSDLYEHIKRCIGLSGKTADSAELDVGFNMMLDVVTVQQLVAGSASGVGRSLLMQIAKKAQEQGLDSTTYLHNLGIATIAITDRPVDYSTLDYSLVESNGYPSDLANVAVGETLIAKSENSCIVTNLPLSLFALDGYALIESNLDTSMYPEFNLEPEQAMEPLDLDETQDGVDFDEADDEFAEVVEEDTSTSDLSDEEEPEFAEDDETKPEDGLEFEEDGQDFEDYGDVSDISDSEGLDDADIDNLDGDTSELTLIPVVYKPRLLFIMEQGAYDLNELKPTLADYNGYNFFLPLQKGSHKQNKASGYLREPLETIVAAVAAMGKDVQVFSDTLEDVRERLDTAFTNTVEDVLNYSLYRQHNIIDADQDPAESGLIVGDFSADTENEVQESIELPLADYVSGGVYYSGDYANIVVRTVFPAFYVAGAESKLKMLRTINTLIHKMCDSYNLPSIVGYTFNVSDLLPNSDSSIAEILNSSELTAGEGQVTTGVISVWDMSVNKPLNYISSEHTYVELENLDSDSPELSLLFGESDMLALLTEEAEVEESEED